MNGENITELFRVHIEKAVNKLLKMELTEFLNYEKYDRSGFNSGNSRNGYYDRRIKTEYGELKLIVPRDRNGEFNNQTLTPYKRHNDTLESTVIQLYSKGITTSEIASLIEKMYGHHYTKQTMSNMTSAVLGDLESFHKRELHKRYAVIYLDATFISLRRDTVAKEAVYFAVGITPEGYKEILAYQIFPTESAYNWGLLLEDIKERGVEEVLLIVTDGLTGIKDTIATVYPKANHQSCWVHITRNVSGSIRVKDRSDVLDDLKKVYTANSVKEAEEQLALFSTTWRKQYPKVISNLNSNTSLFSFLLFPEKIRASLYTTNLIEGLNKHLKRYTKRIEQFPTEESLSRFVMNQAIIYNDKFGSRIHKGFSLVTAELYEMFEQIYN